MYLPICEESMPRSLALGPLLAARGRDANLIRRKVQRRGKLPPFSHCQCSQTISPPPHSLLLQLHHPPLAVLAHVETLKLCFIVELLLKLIEEL